MGKRNKKKLFCESFFSWGFGWLNIPVVIDRAEQIYQYPMTARDPRERWTHGNMTLMGDAAHPMFSIGSNGASQTVLDEIEDGAQQLILPN